LSKEITMAKGEFHREEYLQLADVTHKSAIISWGSFFFRIKDKKGTLKLVDDGDLDHVHPPRSQTIGARSEPYGTAVVTVRDAATGEVAAVEGTKSANFVRVSGLLPDTEYRYEVTVNDEPWADGELLDWVVQDEGGGLAALGGRYDNRFRTHAHPVEPAPLTFAVLGDFGVGVRKASTPGNQQREVALALTRAVTESDVRLVLTTGDNIYAGKKILGIPIGATGDEDDDWFFTFYQPYRYILNRVPFYPCVGNHDSGEIEFENDDREQLMDNFFLHERFGTAEAAPFASIGPGLFYRFRFGANIEFVCLDTSKASPLPGDRFFMHPTHMSFLDEVFRAGQEGAAPVWQVPFGHHPPYTAGPGHHNSTSVITHLLPRFKSAGVRVAFWGHEHNFQHAIAETVNYVVSGGGGKVSGKAPAADRFAGAFTTAWAGEGHFLLIDVDASQMKILPVGALSAEGKLQPILLRGPGGESVPTPIVIVNGPT
jgi:tartrate-resistant acid phosphatase type 5